MMRYDVSPARVTRERGRAALPSGEARPERHATKHVSRRPDRQVQFDDPEACVVRAAEASTVEGLRAGIGPCRALTIVLPAYLPNEAEICLEVSDENADDQTHPAVAAVEPPWSSFAGEERVRARILPRAAVVRLTPALRDCASASPPSSNILQVIAYYRECASKYPAPLFVIFVYNTPRDMPEIEAALDQARRPRRSPHLPISSSSSSSRRTASQHRSRHTTTTRA